LNPAPTNYVWPFLELSNIEAMIGENLSAISLVSLAGLIWVVLQRSRWVEKYLLLSWFLVTGVFFVYSYVWQYFDHHDIVLPNIVPGVHFYFYLHALKAVLFGCGLVAVSQYFATLLARIVPVVRKYVAARDGSERKISRLALGILSVFVFLLTFPAYGYREAFVGGGITNQLTSELRAYRWIRENTQPTDVFLAGRDSGIFIVGQAGRKLVAVDAYFSNPYVDLNARLSDQDRMLNALRSGNESEFDTVASRYSVEYVILRDGDPPDIDARRLSFLHSMFSSGAVQIYRVQERNSAS
jgi:hypothetical protein